MNGHYRSKLTFSWEGMDSAATALQRLRNTVYNWGEAGTPDDGLLARFREHINNDLNMPQALALTWEVVKSDLPADVKKALMLEFDKVLGLRLAVWEPVEEEIPAEILEMAEQRQQARKEKRWQEADALREKITAAGYEVQDTPQGPKVHKK
jgi:cysteinyl-tRNA synthetase